MNNQQLEWEYDQANSLANWSFVGAIIPIVGIALASISMSKLKRLMYTNKNEDTAMILESTRTKAKWGMGLSIFFVMIIPILIYSIIIAGTVDVLNTKCTFHTSGDIYNMESTTLCE